jgi:hypothetical protein
MLNATANPPSCSTIRKETNNRIYDRNIPSKPLQAYLDVRPVMTKYSIMPIVDPRKKIVVPMIQNPTFNVETTFNPGNRESPWSGYSVNEESILRNQIFALQKCSQKEYVPNSTSNLYQWSFQNSNVIQQPHDLLFKEEKFCDFNPNKLNLGCSLFHNSTRAQLKEE